jgi:pyridoxal phosphate enzyme (YggS family)
MDIGANLKHILEEMATAAEAAGRPGSAIRLVAVSKYKPAIAVTEAAAAGQAIFGENYVQEIVAKAAEVTVPVEWHFIGHLQSNKVRQIAGLVTMIHSVDRLSLAEEIDRQWGKIGKACDILVQVNVSGEASKSGTTAATALTLVKEISQLANVRVRGLMTMPPFFDDPEAARPFFRELKELSAAIARENIQGIAMTELSMGMSGDFKVAIEEGATLVRIGTAIFGDR